VDDSPRLTRIEKKLDDLTRGFADLTRIEERQANERERMGRLSTSPRKTP